MTPKFAQIKQYIRNQIETGAWQPHSRLPSENQLAAEFSCSRMTARRALTELTDAGVLARTQGLGTFVAELKSQSSMMAIRNIADEIAMRGHEHRVEQLVLQEITADAPTAIALGLEQESRVFHSVLVHFEQDVPLQIEERFVNPALVPDYLNQDFQIRTPHEYLSQAAPLTQAQHTIEAIVATPEVQHHLQLGSAEPCLQISRRTWSSQGVVSFARLTHPGSRFRLGGHLTF